MAAETTENPLTAAGLPVPMLMGSASFSRKIVLKEMGVPFHKVVYPIDEKALGDRSSSSPEELVQLLAQAKMDHLFSQLPTDPIIVNSEQKEWVAMTADQVVTCDGTILEKPESVEEAKAFNKMYMFKASPATVGSCVFRHYPSGVQVSGIDIATIHYKQVDEEQAEKAANEMIDNFIEQGEPILSCAGAIMIEHPLTKQHLLRIDGTEDSVMGLSKALVLKLFKELAEKIK
eukprot:Nitzschia sp. Nitz4//scaffold90_size81538//31355//32050//NITZ4_005318-RA/size81538-processed-gene-0.48-mRNA-1//-1//CDS//3329560008//6467//frame0